MAFVLYADGASRGNPGPAAIGVVLQDSAGRVLQQFGKRIGLATNNEAEYQAVLAGMDAAIKLGVREIEVRLDSQLIAAQLSGGFKIRAPNLRRLQKQARRKQDCFGQVEFSWVPRSQNALADALANRALDETEIKPRRLI